MLAKWILYAQRQCNLENEVLGTHNREDQFSQPPANKPPRGIWLVIVGNRMVDYVKPD